MGRLIGERFVPVGAMAIRLSGLGGFTLLFLLLSSYLLRSKASVCMLASIGRPRLWHSSISPFLLRSVKSTGGVLILAVDGVRLICW